MDETIESIIEILRANGDDNIASLLTESRFNLIESNTYGSRAHSLLSTAEVYSSAKNTAQLTNLNEFDKEKIRRAVLQIYPIQDASPEIEEILFKVRLKGRNTERELKSIPRPELEILGFPKEIVDLLIQRWNETERCIESRAYLAAIILIGSLLEGLLLGMMESHKREANTSLSSPKFKDGTVKPFSEWKLIEMIEVALTNGWIHIDRAKFSHALREFRNLVHPNLQLKTKVNPDENTCIISWHVVQAACADTVNWKKNNVA